MKNNGLDLITIIDCRTIDDIYRILSNTYYITMGVLEYGVQYGGCELKRIKDGVWCHLIIKEEYRDIYSVYTL